MSIVYDRYVLEKDKREFRAVHELPLVLLPASSTLLLYVISALVGNMERSGLFLYVLAALGALVGANIYILHLIERMAELQEKEGHYILMERIQQDQRTLYQQFLRGHAEVGEVLHDHRNQMLSIKGLLDAGRVSEAVDHICKDIEWSKAVRMVATGVDSLDAVINAKSSIMTEKSIQFSHTLLLPPQIDADPIELGIMVGDLMDNAIEACERIDNVKNRYIIFQITQSGCYLVIRLENPLPPNEVGRRDFETSKQEAGHGYGLESVKRRMEKFLTKL